MARIRFGCFERLRMWLMTARSRKPCGDPDEERMSARHALRVLGLG
jgi:hypothetical protein